jgi:hypothetical protein
MAADAGTEQSAHKAAARHIVTRLRAVMETIAALVFPSAAAQQNVDVVEYPEMCDPSAAVALGDALFIVASDEDNVLRVYAREAVGAPIEFDLNSFLGSDGDHTKTAIQPPSTVRNNGNCRGDEVTVSPVGMPYTKLIDDLAQAPALRKYDLESASRIAPESKGGLNIEGLAATPQGTLLIGFRNPIPGGNALIVPLHNPQQIIEGERAELGPPIELSLNGLGVRSIEYSESRNRYLVVAGPYNDDENVALYDWSGNASDAAEQIPEGTFGGLNPEAMFIYPGDLTAVQFLSDDSGRKLNGINYKEMAPAKQRFRSLSLDIR